MKTFSKILLAISSLALFLYPLWGILSPESFAQELTQHHAHAETYTLQQVSAAAARLWISNSVLAAAFIAMLLFVSDLNKTRAGLVAGALLVLYPIARTAAEVQVAKVMMAPQIGIEFSSEKLFFIVFGITIIAIAGQCAKVLKERAT